MRAARAGDDAGAGPAVVALAQGPDDRPVVALCAAALRLAAADRADGGDAGLRGDRAAAGGAARALRDDADRGASADAQRARGAHHSGGRDQRGAGAGGPRREHFARQREYAELRQRPAVGVHQAGGAVLQRGARHDGGPGRAARSAAVGPTGRGLSRRVRGGAAAGGRPALDGAELLDHAAHGGRAERSGRGDRETFSGESRGLRTRRGDGGSGGVSRGGRRASGGKRNVAAAGPRRARACSHARSTSAKKDEKKES